MIPDLLYIPTSTLNFNNIMSGESISPASFYPIRGFGYKRFEKVAPNSLNNRVLLYDKYPIFDINDTVLENYPMVIEIDTKTLEEDIIKGGKGSFYSEETIYLNPFTTRILFRNSQERLSTVFKAEPSIESKLVDLYERSFVDLNQGISSFNWEKPEIEDTTNEVFKYISKDRKINKLKGLLYAYLIASNKSMSVDVVVLKKHLRSLRNTLSAIITSPNNKATYSQEEQLNYIYNILNEKFRSIFLAPLITEKSEKYQCDFASVLTQENLWESWIRQNNLSKHQIAKFYAPSKDKDRAFEAYMQDLENQVTGIESYQKKADANVSCLPVLQHNSIAEVPEQKEFLIKLFNEYLEEAYNSGEFIQSRYEFGKSGGKIFKEELQDKWDGSQWQKYINELLRNLNEFTSFSLRGANNHTLESFAAFCQKGESEIEKLEDYLIANEIGDFKIAYSLWGIVFGFANMPKTLTNELFLNDNVDYITQVYKHIFKQLHGVELDGRLEKAIPAKQSVEEPKTDDYSQAASGEEQTSHDDLSNQDILNKLKGCKLNPEQLEKITDLYDKNQSIVNDKFFSLIGKIEGIGKVKLKRIKSALEYDVVKSDSTNITEDLKLFEDSKPVIVKEFYKDTNAWSRIVESLPNDKRIQKQVKTDLEWFQGNFNEVYENSRGYYSNKKKDNLSTIDHYNKYLGNKLKSKQHWLREIYEQVNIGKLILKLKEVYLNDE